MHSKETDLIMKAYEIIGELTPLKSDCGRLCGAVCCKGDDDTGMLLFPGEKELYEECSQNFTVTETDYGMPLLLCNGRCNRKHRPLSCRIFPLAIVNKNSSLKIIVDPRSRTMCPLYRQAVNNRLDPAFVSAVKQAGKVLFESEAIMEFTAEIYKQCLEFTGL